MELLSDQCRPQTKSFSHTAYTTTFTILISFVDNNGGGPEEWPHCSLLGTTVDAVQGQPLLRVAGISEDARGCQKRCCFPWRLTGKHGPGP